MEPLAEEIRTLEWNILSTIDEIALVEHFHGREYLKLKDELAHRRNELKKLYREFMGQCEEFYAIIDY